MTTKASNEQQKKCRYFNFEFVIQFACNPMNDAKKVATQFQNICSFMSVTRYSIISQIDRRNIRPINFRNSHFIYNLNPGSTFCVDCCIG